MDSVINSIDAFLSDYFNIGIPDIRVTDILEIIIIAVLIYQVLAMIKDSRAFMLLRGILVIGIFFLIASLFQMSTILWLGEKFVSIALLSLVVVFQPELRAALERLGRRSMWRRFLFFVKQNEEQKFSDATLNGLVDACVDMGSVKTGALIVLENEVGLNEFVSTGIRLDSLLSRALLINIFEKNTPLHDGAIIVRGDRIVAATCYLPLSSNPAISKNLGTRHRAAIGLTEVSDAVVLVVSEETGSICLASGGMMIHGLDRESLKKRLLKIQQRKIKNPGEEGENKPEEEGTDGND